MCHKANTKGMYGTARASTRRRRRSRHYYCKPESSFALREEDESDMPADVRRWRFMASVPGVVVFSPARPVGESLVAVNMFPVVEERGRVEEEAIFGKLEAPLRVVPFGVPEARFLPHNVNHLTTVKVYSIPLLNHVCLQGERANDAMKLLTQAAVRRRNEISSEHCQLT
jgi:hypothetical protein